MALVINDRVKVNSTATGTSQTTFAIDNTPVTGFETFNTGIGVGNTTYYCIFNQGTSEFEVGLGTLDGTSANAPVPVVVLVTFTLSFITKAIYSPMPYL